MKFFKNEDLINRAGTVSRKIIKTVMEQYIKANLRLERAQRKINKRIYPSCAKSKEVVKLNERRNQLNKDIERTFELMYSKGFKPNKDNQNPIYFADFDFILICEKEIEKISKKVVLICSTLGKTEEDINKEMYLLNAGKGSISF